jgi:predicted CoA-binding protein
MKHMTREEALNRRVLQRARTVAIIGASPNPARHSNSVANYLRTAGYDVIPVRPDGADVAGLPASVMLTDVAGPIDLVVIFRRPEAVPAHIDEAAAKHVEVVWLQPGVWSPQAEAAADRRGLTLVKELCIAEEHRHLSGSSAGHPAKWGVHVRRRKPTYEDNRQRPDDSGYVAGGGGGHVAGGGVRATVDEKKMVKGAPSRRSGKFRRKPQ